MVKKILIFAFISIFSLTTIGCMVSKKSLRKCQDESKKLDDDLDALRKEYITLQGENDKLNEQIRDLTSQVNEGESQLTKLRSENSELEDLLQAKSDELSQKIMGLREKIAALEDERDQKTQKISQLEQRIRETDREKENKLKKMSETYNAMMQKMKGEIEKGQITITELKGKLTVNMVDAILFELGKSEISPEGEMVLQKVVDVLKEVVDKEIRVEGHTDNLTIHGALAKKYATNWELSAARAVNVIKYLQSQGINPTILSAAAFSEYKPVASNDTKEGRAKNRRIEITLIPK